MSTVEIVQGNDKLADVASRIAECEKVIETFTVRPGRDAAQTVTAAYAKIDELTLERDAAEAFDEYLARKGPVSLSTFDDQAAYVQRNVAHFHERDRRDGAMARQARELQSANNQRVRPSVSLSDLESELSNINEQVRHWRGVAESVRIYVDDYKNRVKAAQEILEELFTVNPLTREQKEDLAEARAAIDSLTPDLQAAERRLRNAETQLVTWSDRERAFDHATYNKLRADANRRAKLKSRYR